MFKEKKREGDPFWLGKIRRKSHLFSRVLILSHMGLDDDAGDHARVVETTDGDHHHQGDEHRADDVFPSRKIARALREKLFHALRVVWMQFELYGWYVLLALVVYLTFRRQIRGCLGKLWSTVARRKEKSFSAEEREELKRARRKQEEQWKKASKEKLTSKTNIDKRIEAVEKKANRLGVAKQRKGHVLGRE